MSDEPSFSRSGLPRSSIPTQEDAESAGFDPASLPKPGEAPYTRGIHEKMYRKRLWTMRQYAGFSTAKATNERFRLLLESGQTGLSVAFDLPTQLGLDSDDALSEGEVGKVGVAIDSLEDMRTLFSGIDLSSVSTSMTINAPATTLLAMYVSLADELGIPRSQLRGTVQNDILKEYIARGLYIFPPGPSARLTTDLFEWSKKNTPSWNTISVSGYHMREAGCSAVEEVGLTLANGLFYVKKAIEAGLEVDDFAPRMSFFFGCHNDFLEEIAKFRAARFLWHEQMSKRFQFSNEKSSKLRFHTQTAGVTLTAQQPMNNAIRVAYQALSAVLGGTQSLHTNSYDEAIGLPTDDAVKIALRTQQIIADETGVSNVVDPLAGSYIIEEMTMNIVKQARDIIEQIEALGGAEKAMMEGVQQRMIHDSAWKELSQTEKGILKVVGVNHHVETEENAEHGMKLDEELVSKQIIALSNFKNKRDEKMVKESLENLRNICSSDENLMEPIIDSVKAGATIGEINGIFREEFGTWMSPSGV